MDRHGIAFRVEPPLDDREVVIEIEPGVGDIEAETECITKVGIATVRERSERFRTPNEEISIARLEGQILVVGRDRPGAEPLDGDKPLQTNLAPRRQSMKAQTWRLPIDDVTILELTGYTNRLIVDPPSTKRIESKGITIEFVGDRDIEIGLPIVGNQHLKPEVAAARCDRTPRRQANDDSVTDERRREGLREVKCRVAERATAEVMALRRDGIFEDGMRRSTRACEGKQKKEGTSHDNKIHGAEASAASAP